MLKHLFVKNYAIIRETQIEFDSRMNIITGETGAGKSILMGALGLILGERADTRVLHQAHEKCIVEGTFNIEAYALRNFFEKEGLDYEDTCFIRREITGNGKSRAFINDTPVGLQQLKELGGRLVDIVSQNETLELNNLLFQIQVVDAYADTGKLLETYQNQYKEWRETERKLNELIAKETQAKRDEDYLRFILTELVDAKLLPDEINHLENKIDLLSHAEQIQLSATHAYNELASNEQSVIDALNNVKNILNPTARHHIPISQLLERLQSCIIELRDIAIELENIAENTESNPEELACSESRLQIIVNLLKKHQVGNIQDLLDLSDKLSSDLSAISSLQDEILATQKSIYLIEKNMFEVATKISEKRSVAIPKMEKALKNLLGNVQMPDAVFKVNIQKLEKLSETGADEIQFLFAANKGSQLQPMNKVASGGEMSRVMLCIKSLINDKVALPTIVFDEIDTGISGEAALKVSQVMKQHATSHQVIAITHLPQIAGKADAHFYVYKTTDSHTTHTHIKKLSENERVEEIARMLHGQNPSAKVLEAAKELMS
jgi:DNA repair protein RecN (Recombination protein N)